MKFLSAWIVSALLAACPATSPFDVTTTTGRGRSTSGTGAGGAAQTSSSTSAASTGTGTSTGGSSGSSSGSSSSSSGQLVCPAVLGDCDAGVELLAQVVDAVAGTPISASVQISDLDNPAYVTNSDPDGVLVVCVSPYTILAPELAVDGYVTSLFRDIDLVTSECVPRIELFSAAVWEDISSQLEGYVANDGALLVAVSNVLDATHRCSLSGWAFSVAMPDGGTVSSSIAYVSGVSVAPNTSSTTPEGYAILYDIDPSVTEVQVTGTQVVGADAGELVCGQALDVYEYTSIIQLEAGALSTYSFVVADAG